MTEERIKMIKHDLLSLEPLEINIEDEGHLHVGTLEQNLGAF